MSTSRSGGEGHEGPRADATPPGKGLRWTFRVLAILNALLLAAAFLYQSPGEDPAGAGMRLGFAMFYAIALAAVMLIYHFARTPWVRVPMLILLALPAVSILYGISLSL